MPAPLSSQFLASLDDLERAYLTSDDPMGQSGFAGGAARWRAERGIILEAISHSGTFLDIGCANGFLLESLVEWAQEGGIRLDPFGLDCSALLVDLARTRFPDLGSHFFAANAWDWTPPHRFDFVYTLVDCVPASHLPDHLRRLLSVAVAPGGRLIVGSYGSRSRFSSAQDVGALLGELGLPVAGSASASIDDTRLASIAWTVKSPPGVPPLTPLDH